MRITDRVLATNFIDSLNKGKNDIQRLQKQISTNSKIQAPSDSPAGTAKVMRLNNQLENNLLYKKNMEEGLAFVKTSVSLMESMNEQISGVNKLIMDVNNPINSENISLYASKVDSALTTLLDLANSQVEGKYVFGGTDHSAAPYGLDMDVVLPPGTPRPVEVKVSSVAGEHSIQISKGMTQKINTTGDELFGTIATDDIFNTLISVREDLKNGIRPSDEAVARIKGFETNLLNKISSQGDVMNRLENTTELVDNQILETKSLISGENDVDIAEAVMDLQNQQYFLDLSYKMSSMILPKSLLDFM